MIVFYVVLFAGACLSGASGASSNVPTLPPYVQSRDKFLNLQSYVFSYLPRRPLDIHKKEDLPKISMGILLGLVGNMVLELKDDPQSSPLLVIQNHFPHVYRNYTYVSQRLRSTLQRAKNKMQALFNLMDSLCQGIPDLEECNQRVKKVVEEKRNLYGPAANLLISTYPTSQFLDLNREKLDDLLKRNWELPYLFSHYKDAAFKKLLSDLVKSYDLLNRTPTARSN